MKQLEFKTKLLLFLLLGSIFPLISGALIIYINLIEIFVHYNIGKEKLEKLISITQTTLVLETLWILILFVLLKLSIEKSFQTIFKNLEEIKKNPLEKEVTIKNNNQEFLILLEKIKDTINKTKNAPQLMEKKIQNQTEKLLENKKLLEDQQIALLNVLEDMEQEKQKAEEGEKKLNALIHSIGEGMFVLDENQKIQSTNSIAEKICGYAKEELIGKEIQKTNFFVSEKTNEKKFEFLKTIYKEKKAVESDGYTVLEKKQKELIPIFYSASPIKNKKEEIIGCVIVFRDTSKEREINRMKSEFVSVASHQLRTPLTSLNWYLELLLTQEAGNLTKEQKEYIENSYQETKRMSDLVTQLLNVSKIETGELGMNYKKTSIKNFLETIEKETLPFAKNKKMEVSFEYKEAKDLQIEIDASMMHQVMHNLIINAIKYSPEKSKIKIETKKEKQHIQIAIQDKGIGIPKNIEPRIFEKFFRAGNAITKQTDGTGLGLYISKMIIEAHHGNITFKTQEKKGTTFFVTLPLTQKRK